jgi:hypothetical protein
MKIIYNVFLPVKGFSAMAFFGIILARKEYKPLSERTILHEQIHEAQAKECGGWFLFYLKYLWFWIQKGYRYNPFEFEAYVNDSVSNYLETREKNEWKHYKNW